MVSKGLAMGARRIGVAALFAAALGLSACKDHRENDSRPEAVRAFPIADRPVSHSGDSGFATEVQRDSLNEAHTVMDLARIERGMTVADIGAGEGYYTVRLATRVGAKGRVLAEDIDAEAISRLGLRIERERLQNVSIKAGLPEDPRLPEGSFDRIFLVHMYHEVGEPYAFLWNLRPALKAKGRVIVVDVDRPTDSHGIPPALLFCEFAAVGFRLTEFVRKPELQGYYAQFEASGPRPAPGEIKSCRLAATPAAAGR